MDGWMDGERERNRERERERERELASKWTDCVDGWVAIQLDGE